MTVPFNDEDQVKKQLPTFEDLKVCLIGHSSFMYDIARALNEVKIKIACVVTDIDESNGLTEIDDALSKEGIYHSMKDIAEIAQSPLLYFSDVNNKESISKISSTGANILISCSAPILKQGIINHFNMLTFNFHGSKFYRGRGGASWLILNGKKMDSVVLHWLNLGIDTGCSICEEPFSLADSDQPIDLFKKQKACFYKLTLKLGEYLKAQNIPAIEQPKDRPYFPSLYTSIDGEINWRDYPVDIFRTIQAFGYPYSGAWSTLENSARSTKKRVSVARASIPRSNKLDGFHPKTFGCIVGINKDLGSITVACKGGAIEILSFRDKNEEIPALKVAKLGMRFT
jgi:methionyl-tRNA formyltransferase